MKRTLIIFLSLIVGSSCLVFFAGGFETLILKILKPSSSFSDCEKVQAPDYSDLEYWAAHAEIDDLSDRRPEGILADTIMEDINIFFIHPTGYLHGNHWNSHMDPKSMAEDNTRWMMANQASVFSDGIVYAPRYREATIHSFIDITSDDALAALDFAYQDVKKAFEYFIKEINNDQPFIIASHSQGTYHGLRLLKEEIDNKELSNKLIAAYLIGMSTITNEAVEELRTIAVCNSADQTNCLIHWATFAENAPSDEQWGENMICVNPLNWKQNGTAELAAMHKGYVPTSGNFSLKFYGSDQSEGVEFLPLAEPKPNHTPAQCYKGRLLVDEQPNQPDGLGEGNYHGLDYLLFHMDIRLNVAQRVRAYLKRYSVDIDKATSQLK